MLINMPLNAIDGVLKVLGDCNVYRCPRCGEAGLKPLAENMPPYCPGCLIEYDIITKPELIACLKKA